MQSVMMNRMDDKETENKVKSEMVQSDQELSTSDPNQDSDAVSLEDKQEGNNGSTSSTVKNTVHVQHTHSLRSVQTTILPRELSEQSKVRILTRTPAVSISSTPSEESNEDVPPENFHEKPTLQHQTSSKDADCESGPPSLSSSRDSSFDYTDSTGTDLNDFIMKTLKNQRDKKMLLKLEKDFIGFISDPRKVLLQYPPMTSYHRMIVHRVAAYFGLDHNVDQTGKCIIVNKCNNTRYPEHRFADLVREDSEEDPLPKLILKRQNSLSDESGPPEGRRSSHSRRSLEGKKSKSIEEREEEYKKARSRIFNHQNHGSLSSQSSASSRDGDSILPCLTDQDGESERAKSLELSENVGDAKTVDLPQTDKLAIRVLTNRSRTPPEDLPKLALDAGSYMDASSSAPSAHRATTATDSKFDSSSLARSVDTSTVSAEGAPYLARSIPSGDVSVRSKIMEMIPQLSPNQTGGVVWTLPENQALYPPGQAAIFPTHETSGQMVAPDGFQPSNIGLQPGVSPPAFFFPNQAAAPSGPPFHGQVPPRQSTPPQQQQQTQGGFPAQVLPMAAQFVQPTNFQVFQQPRIFNQQELEILPQQSTATASPQAMIAPNTASQAPNYQELSGQFSGLSLNPLDQQEQPRVTAAFPPGSTQTFPSGQPVRFMVYRNMSGNMVATPVSNAGQINPGYMYSPPTPHPYTQQGYNQSMYNQVLTQQPFNQGFPLADQTILAQGSGSHTHPTPPQSGAPINANAAFISHVQTIPGAAGTRPQLPPVMPHLPTRIMNPYAVQGQPVVQIPAGQQVCYTQPPYAVGQNRPNLQQSTRYRAYTEKGGSKCNDNYSCEQSNLRRPSPSDSPRGTSMSGQSRKSSGGSGKSGHSKGDGQRSHYQQGRGKTKHKKNQHKHGGDSSRKQLHSAGSSSLEMEQPIGGFGSCVLEVYDVTSNSRDQVVEDLIRAGAKIRWNEKTKQSSGGKMFTAKATFNSLEQAEQALMTNSNPNFKLRRCPADIPFMENQNY